MDMCHNKKYFNFTKYDEIKIGVLSDTHNYINPAIYEHLAGCDLILHAGDIGSIDVINQLYDISDNVISVCGNNDNSEQWHSSEQEDLEKLPHVADIEIQGGVITLTHGDAQFCSDTWHDKLRDHYPTAKTIIYGHSHQLVCDQSELPWVLNPGAAGETRIKRHGVSCMRIDANSKKWKVTEFRV
jgi:putative phosphoesterase